MITTNTTSDVTESLIMVDLLNTLRDYNDIIILKTNQTSSISWPYCVGKKTRIVFVYKPKKYAM